MEAGSWSLFCALKHASISVTGEYNHHNTAMQVVREEIERLLPESEYQHPLMDFNNDPQTSHSNILRVLATAKNRIRGELRHILSK